jgi:hypothetical protein
MKMECTWRDDKKDLFFGSNSDSDKISSLNDEIVKILTKISSEIIQKFINRENFDYLDSFLKETLGKNLEEKLDEQRIKETHYPMYENTFKNYMEILSSHSDLMVGLQSEYSGDYHEDINNVKDLLIEFYETIFGNICIKMKKYTSPYKQDYFLTNLKDPEFQELTEAAEEITEEDLINKFDANRKDEYLERFKNANLTRIIVEVLLVDFLPLTKNRIENNFWINDFDTFLNFQKMNMKPKTDAEDLKNIRQLAVIFGELPIDPELDRPQEEKDVNFLDVVNDGRLLI